jgi:pteridine reductase
MTSPSNQSDSDRPVAWVTGSGAPRVGRVIAAHFAAQGYRIALHSLHSTAEATECANQWNQRGIPTILTHGAVEAPETADQAISEIRTAFGSLDCLVNSAAIWDEKSLEETTAADVRRQFEVNSLGHTCAVEQPGFKW